MICNLNCFNCTYDDCVNGCTFRQEILFRYNNSKKCKEAQKRYNNSDKGKETQKRYNHSDKGKARLKRYRESEKGKANERRKHQKKIASGRNAEACRRYRERKKQLA